MICFCKFQDTTNTLVRHCGSRFFSLPLPGSTMMILDFIHAANTIASTTDLKEVKYGLLLLFCTAFLYVPWKEIPFKKIMTLNICFDCCLISHVFIV